MENKLIQAIENASRIAIFSHVTPDADAICSSLALQKIINKHFDSKHVDVFVNEIIDNNLQTIFAEDDHYNPETRLEQYDLAFILDCPNLERIGEDFTPIAENIPTIVNIDHHESNSNFGTLNYMSPTVSSTCELVYRIAQGNNLEITDEIAKLLYQGIITDTICFHPKKTKQKTLEIAEELESYRIYPDVIKKHFFEDDSEIKKKLMVRALLSRKLYHNNMFYTMKLTQPTLQHLNASFGDTRGIIDNEGKNTDSDTESNQYSFSHPNAEVKAILIEQEPNFIHVSLRGKGNINIGDIAKLCTGGGSHDDGAFQMEGDIYEVEQLLVQALGPFLEDINNPSIS